MTAPLLGPAALALLREALADYTVDGVQMLLGPVGLSAHQRGDLAGVARALPAGERLSTLVRMFLLGEVVPEPDARAALRPLDPAAVPDLVEVSGASARARLDVRPYATDYAGPWWVVSDFGSDVRPGPLAPDHVLGIGGASLTLAAATPRRPAARALDLGTGCGIQALHAATHCDTVVATDVSERALRLAATTAWLSGQTWDLRRGSLFDPVVDERFDLVVANPPFVVSPGDGSAGYDYRDSGLAGDEVCERLLRGVAHRLAEGGCATLLANWIVPDDGDWGARVAGWLDASPADAWVWQREVVEPGAYIALWLRDAGEVPGTPRWRELYDRWAAWFEGQPIAAVGMGTVFVWRNDSGTGSVVYEDVPQAVEQPPGAHVPDWIRRRRWLAGHDDAGLLAARLRHAPGLVRTRQDRIGDAGWQTEASTLLLPSAMRWEVECDDAVGGLVAACDGTVPLAVLTDVLAAMTDSSTDEVTVAVLPVVRDLVTRGLLEPAEADA